MKIEEVTKTVLGKAFDNDLYMLRVRFVNFYKKYFAGSRRKSMYGLQHDEVLNRYALLIKEFKRRNLRFVRGHEIDEAALRNTLIGFDLRGLEDIVLAKDFVCIGGQFARNPQRAKVVEVAVCKMQREELETKIAPLVKQKTEKETTFAYEPEAMVGTVIPLFDLMLRPKTETVRKKIKALAAAAMQSGMATKQASKVQQRDAARKMTAGDTKGLRARLEARTKALRTEIKKPEVAGKNVRIPVGAPCDITATIVIDAAKGIKALYCGKEKRIRTYLFDNTKWNMDSAKAWIREHAGKYAKQMSLITKGEPYDIAKPYENEHSARLQPPDRYDEYRRTAGGEIYFSIEVPKTIGIIWGHPRGQPPKRWVPQALRFPVEHWTVDAAKKWLKDNDVKYISFEPAKTKKTAAIDVRKKLTAAQRKECDAETARIKENAERPVAKQPHQFKAAKYTHPNGHPRCLTCGDEQPIGDVCNMKSAWYDKHEWDDADAWTKERAELRNKGIIKDEWLFKIYKQVKTKQIVGGVVYEPEVVDTQDDITSAQEIQDAMYAFMEKYAADTSRIKVQHEGHTYQFPILECFQPEQDITRGGKTVKKGSWWMMVKVTNDAVWKDIVEGRLNAFSMGGTAATGKNNT